LPRQVVAVPLCDFSKWQGYDAIHTYSVVSHLPFLSLVLKNLAHVPGRIVLRAEVGPPSYGFAPNVIYERIRKNYAYSKYFKFVTQNVDMIYAFTPLESESLISLGVRPNKVGILPVPIEFNTLSKITPQEEPEWVNIGYLGRFVPVKGLHLIAKSLGNIMTVHKRTRFIASGPVVDPTYFDHIKEGIRFGPGRVEITPGYAPNFEFLQRVNILLAPSISESGAKYVLDAMAAGVPVLALNSYVINQYINDGENGFLYRDLGEFEAKLSSLVSDSSLRRRLGRNAREYARSHDINVVCDSAEKMYRGL
jgi:glycosyltransferase involved in cell wall biosynthesis